MIAANQFRILGEEYININQRDKIYIFNHDQKFKIFFLL
jgi:hypothetical protein